MEVSSSDTSRAGQVSADHGASRTRTNGRAITGGSELGRVEQPNVRGKNGDTRHVKYTERSNGGPCRAGRLGIVNGAGHINGVDNNGEWGRTVDPGGGGDTARTGVPNTSTVELGGTSGVTQVVTVAPRAARAA